MWKFGWEKQITSIFKGIYKGHFFLLAIVFVLSPLYLTYVFKYRKYRNTILYVYIEHAVRWFTSLGRNVLKTTVL